MSPTRTTAACIAASEAEHRPFRSAVITARVVDFNDVDFPEMALAREHARRLKEQGK